MIHERRWFEATKARLDKATLVAAMESKVNIAITTIWSKIEVAQCDLEKEGSLDPQQKIQLETEIQVFAMNLDLLGVKHVARNNVPNLQVSKCN